MNGIKNKAKENANEMEFNHAGARKLALEEGLLVDVSDEARKVGFRCPVTLTRAVYEQYVRVPEVATGKDEAGRLRDLLWMLSHATGERGAVSPALETKYRLGSAEVVLFRLFDQNGKGPEFCPAILKAVCGAGDEDEQVITVMLRDEA